MSLLRNFLVGGGLVGAAAVFTLACAGCVGEARAYDQRPAADSGASAGKAPALATQKVQLTIEGMTCAETCPLAVRTTLKKLVGVASVDLDYAEKRATVAYDPAQVNPEQLVQAVAGLGYQVKVL